MRVLEISLLWLLLRETVIMLSETYPLLGKLQLEIVVGTITGPYYVHKNVIKSKQLLLWLRRYYVADYWSEI